MLGLRIRPRVTIFSAFSLKEGKLTNVSIARISVPIMENWAWFIVKEVRGGQGTPAFLCVYVDFRDVPFARHAKVPAGLKVPLLVFSFSLSNSSVAPVP